MKVLFIGGTGDISTDCVELAVARGHDVTLLNRGKTEALFTRPVKTVIGDRHDLALLKRVADEGRYDVVVDFIGFTAEDAEEIVAAFSGKIGQLVYISSVAAYEKPPKHYVHTESTPLKAPLWEYSKGKIASENVFLREFRERDFPITIVRPWRTYGKTRIPTALMGFQYTAVDRARKGRPFLVHGDGQSLWGMLYAEDFAVGVVGLFGNQAAIGEAVHIGSDEILTWDQIHRQLARAAGGPDPEIVHIPSELVLILYPEHGLRLMGDWCYSCVYDTSKLKRLVPEFRTRTLWAEGVAKAIAWMGADPSRREVDEELNRQIDHMIDVMRRARLG